MLDGRNAVVADDALEEHLRDCPECQAELETLDHAGDAFLFRLQSLLNPSSIQTDPILQQAVARLSPLNDHAAIESRDVHQHLATGTTLGEFRIVRELPGGGMGRIYEAIQQPLGRRVALKTIRGDRLAPEKQERFLREQSVLAALHQTHIVPIHTAGQVGDLQYFAMPYIEGVTFQQIIGSVRRSQSSSPHARTPTLAQLAHRFDSTVLVGNPKPETNSSTEARIVPVPPEKLRLSADYFRSVAIVMLEAAEACQHVHGMQILHRDLKPSNLMVDTAGECWIIDFGLAHFLNSGASSESAEAARSPDVVDSTRVERHLTQERGGRPGTPPYMAPEQWKHQKVDVRTDVWGLGVTLYEMLTLQPAFSGSLREIEGKVQTGNPTPPRELVSGVPQDLEAICAKALQKEPGARYQTAQEFAADLRRWLNHEPVAARRTRVPRRVWLWARRNRGWAAAIVVSLFACAGAAAAEIRVEQNRAAAAERESLILKMQSIQLLRLLPHQTTDGKSWLEDGQQLVREAAQTRKDDVLRDQAAAYLAGANATLRKVMRGFRASSVAFDADGRRLVVGGSDDDEARIWDSAADQIEKSGLAGAGPVTFRPDGTAWQLTATKKKPFPLQLSDVARHRLIRELNLPELPDKSTGDPATVELALTTDGRFAAAAIAWTGQPTLLAVWDTENGNVVRRSRQSGAPATAVAISDDGASLAVGDATGQITLWPLPVGEPISVTSTKRVRVNCLAFGANPPGQAKRDASDKWLLASGDHGGGVTIWDLARRIPSSYCRGSYYDVFALAFSPDGVTLASAGRNDTRLWDIATGRALLEIRHSDYMTGIAFSRDASKLAVSLATDAVASDPTNPSVLVWDVESHRGIQALRGLESQIAHSKVAFTRDGSRIAALSLGWQAAVWDLPSGFLRYRFEVTPALTADNAGLAFSPDGRKFAVSVGSEARLWDLDAHTETAWQLPEGLVDTLVFDETGTRLFLARMETSDWAHPPNGRSSFQDYPRVCRVRDLLASPERDLRRPEKGNPAWQTDFFNRRIVIAQASPDGRYLIVTGDHGLGRDKPQRLVKVFEIATGQELWSMPGEGAHLDTTGRVMQVASESLSGTARHSLIEVPSGKLIGSINPPPSALAPGARMTATQTANRFGFALYRAGEQNPLVTLGLDVWIAEGYPTFSGDGTRLAWGNQDGTVSVCYIPEIQRRLAAIGLGW